MAITTDQSRFVFRGNAMPFGGRIVNIGGTPVSKPIEGPPSSAITVAGGRSYATGKPSSFNNIFKWGDTVAESVGLIRPADGHAVTTVTSMVKSFAATNAPITFEADVLKAVIVSDHPTRGQPSIKITEAVFGGSVGMFLNGKRIVVEVDDFTPKFGTLALFESQYRTNNAFYTRYNGRFRRSSTKAPLLGERLPRVGGYVSTSIVRSIQWNGKKINGHVLPLTGFGKIYFGELLMNENNRRLTIIRLAMGSHVNAESACAEADPNGSWD